MGGPERTRIPFILEGTVRTRKESLEGEERSDRHDTGSSTLLGEVMNAP